MNVKLLALFFIMCTSFQVAAASASYSISLSNFDEVFGIIVSKHQAAFELDNQGIGVSPVRDYLRSLLYNDPDDSLVAPPSMCVANDFKDELLIDVSGEFETYHFSYLKFSNGVNQATEYSTTDFLVPIEDGWQFSLLAIYGISEGVRSGLYLIIIDKDLARCNTICRDSQWSLPGSSEANGGGFVPPNNALRIFPNPTSDQAQLTFQLTEAQKVSLQLLNPSTGQIILRRLEDQYFPEGQHQYDLDLKVLQAGTYLILLRTENQLQSVPIIKTE